MKPLVITSFFLMLMQYSCTKDQTTTEILSSHTWKVSAATISPGIINPATGTLTTDLYSLAGPCFQDNVYSFTVDGKYVIDEGPIKCNASDPQLKTDNLNLSEDEKTFTAAGVLYTFEEVSKNKIVYSFNASVNNTTQTAKFTIVPK